MMGDIDRRVVFLSTVPTPLGPPLLPDVQPARPFHRLPSPARRDRFVELTSALRKTPSADESDGSSDNGGYNTDFEWVAIKKSISDRVAHIIYSWTTKKVITSKWYSAFHFGWSFPYFWRSKKAIPSDNEDVACQRQDLNHKVESGGVLGNQSNSVKARDMENSVGNDVNVPSPSMSLPSLFKIGATTSSSSTAMRESPSSLYKVDPYATWWNGKVSMYEFIRGQMSQRIRNHSSPSAAATVTAADDESNHDLNLPDASAITPSLSKDIQNLQDTASGSVLDKAEFLNVRRGANTAMVDMTMSDRTSIIAKPFDDHSGVFLPELKFRGTEQMTGDSFSMRLLGGKIQLHVQTDVSVLSLLLILFFLHYLYLLIVISRRRIAAVAPFPERSRNSVEVKRGVTLLSATENIQGEERGRDVEPVRIHKRGENCTNERREEIQATMSNQTCHTTNPPPSVAAASFLSLLSLRGDNEECVSPSSSSSSSSSDDVQDDHDGPEQISGERWAVFDDRIIHDNDRRGGMTRTETSVHTISEGRPGSLHVLSAQAVALPDGDDDLTSSSCANSCNDIANGYTVQFGEFDNDKEKQTFLCIVTKNDACNVPEHASAQKSLDENNSKMSELHGAHLKWADQMRRIGSVMMYESIKDLNGIESLLGSGSSTQVEEYTTATNNCSGGIMIIRAASIGEAREIAETDPLHQERVCNFCITRWDQKM